MPYHIGGEIADRSKLNVQTPASLRARLNLDVRVLSEVTGIDTAAKTVTVSEVETGKVYTESYDELVLSLGAKPLLPPIPGIERAGNLTLRSLEDMDRIISWMEGAETGGTKATSAVIAGGGFIGLEMVRLPRPSTARRVLPARARAMRARSTAQAEQLRKRQQAAASSGSSELHRATGSSELTRARPPPLASPAQAEQLKRHGLDVTIVEALPQLLAPVDPETASQLQHRFEERGVKVILNSPIQGFEPRSDASARGSDVLLGDGVRLSADMVIIGLGIRADSPLAKAAGIELGARGAIVVDGQLRTSAPNVWAIGDAIEVANPILGGQWMVALAGPANREGRLCAHNICAGQNGHGPAREYKGTYGASALRCFGLSVAWVGVNERALQMANVEYGQVHVHSSSHASYYPGACTVSLKLLFRMGGGADDGKILGAQAVAEDGMRVSVCCDGSLRGT
jgi:NADPH-dependent 2,4-dienoyl-CoA reductase/sulfur reductase-like enzyme